MLALNISEAAIAMVRELYSLVPGEQSISESAYASAIAAPVVAAELRALAERVNRETSRAADYSADGVYTNFRHEGMDLVAQWAEQRARELDL